MKLNRRYFCDGGGDQALKAFAPGDSSGLREAIDERVDEVVKVGEFANETVAVRHICEQ